MKKLTVEMDTKIRSLLGNTGNLQEFMADTVKFKDKANRRLLKLEENLEEMTTLALEGM